MKFLVAILGWLWLFGIIMISKIDHQAEILLMILWTIVCIGLLELIDNLLNQTPPCEK